MYDRNLKEYWDAMVESGVATEEELSLVTDLNGYSIETLNDILYCRVGENDVEEYFFGDVEDEDKDDDELDDQDTM